MISVIIPAFNAANTVSLCLAALEKQSMSSSLYEIIVVDDGSTDGTAELAMEAGAHVIKQTRSWPAAARNAGVDIAEGDIICFTDADCIPEPDWLAAMSVPFQDPSIVGCKGTYATNQNKIVARFVQLEYEDKYDRLSKQEQIDFIDTYSAAYRRDILIVNDGFDPRFPYLEDQELSFRLSARGYKMVFQPQATVYHRHSETLQQYMRKKFRIGFWKAQVVRRFPDRGLKDSHTPQTMKVQMVLMALIYLLMLSLLVTSWAVLPLVSVIGTAVGVSGMSVGWGVSVGTGVAVDVGCLVTVAVGIAAVAVSVARIISVTRATGKGVDVGSSVGVGGGVQIGFGVGCHVEPGVGVIPFTSGEGSIGTCPV